MSRIDREIQFLNQDIERFLVEFKNELLSRIKRRTPVRTGELQRGWATEDTEEGFDITNDKEYAEYVEYGTPLQKPQGMVRTTLEEADQIADIAARRSGLSK